MSLKSIARKNSKRGIAKQAIAQCNPQGIIILDSDGKVTTPVVPVRTGRGFTKPCGFTY